LKRGNLVMKFAYVNSEKFACVKPDMWSIEVD